VEFSLGELSTTHAEQEMNADPHAIRQTHVKGHASISQYPYNPVKGISPYRGPYDARLTHLFYEGQTPIQYITFGGLQGAQKALEEVLGKVVSVYYAPAELPCNQTPEREFAWNAI
jgi:hypothetical protein